MNFLEQAHDQEDDCLHPITVCYNHKGFLFIDQTAQEKKKNLIVPLH